MVGLLKTSEEETFKGSLVHIWSIYNGRRHLQREQKKDEKLLLTLQQCKMESDSILRVPLDFTKARFPPTRKGLEY